MLIIDGERKIVIKEEYESLMRVLLQALLQAQEGKGRERHSNVDEAFEDQLICSIGRKVGNGYELGQAIKKIVESQRLLIIKGKEAAITELLGAINYTAAGVILYEEKE
jgi:hypothetical protein